MKKITSALLIYLLSIQASFALSLSGDDWKNPLRTKTWHPPLVSDTLAGLNATQELKNKTFDRTLNTLLNLNITNSDVSASAAIAYSKLAPNTASRALVSDGSGFITTSSTTAAQVGYLSTTSGDVQVSLDSKTPKSVVSAKGSLMGATANSTPAEVPIGNDGEVLSVVSTNANNLGYRKSREDLGQIGSFQGFEAISNWSTGNNANVMGGGTISGTLVRDTTAPLNPSAGYKYTQSSGSLNDYFCSPSFVVGPRFKGNTAYFSTPYTYDGASGDIAVSLYDVTNSAVIPINNVGTITSTSTAANMIVSATIPLTTANARLCYQVKALNNGKIFNLDDMQLTQSLASFGVIRSLDAEVITHSAAGSTMITSSVNYQFNLSNVLRTSNGIISVSNVSGITRFTALKKAYFHLTMATSQANVAEGFAIRKNGTVIATSNNNSDTTYATSGGVNIQLDAGDYVTITGGTLTSGDGVYLTILSYSESSAIASPTQQVSSDNMVFSFKSTAIVDTDPVGTFNTYKKAANSLAGATILISTAPSQSTSSMNTNGILLTCVNYATAGSDGSPQRYDIKIGKNLKGWDNIIGYNATGKPAGGSLQLSMFPYNTAELYGLNKVYNETTGILTIDCGNINTNAITQRGFLNVGGGSGVLSGYFVFNASATPSITAIPLFVDNVKMDGAVNPKVFGLSLQNAVCSSTPCTPSHRLNTSVLGSTFPRASTGDYTVTFNGITVSVCSVVINPISSQANRCQLSAGYGGGSARVLCFNSSSVPVDEGFSLNCIGY